MSEDSETEVVFPKIRETFYITATTNLNGVLDISSEGKEAHSLEDAIDEATNNVTEYGDVHYVIECRAVRSVTGRSPSVRKIAR